MDSFSRNEYVPSLFFLFESIHHHLYSRIHSNKSWLGAIYLFTSTFNYYSYTNIDLKVHDF